MASVYARRKLKGVDFVVDEDGEKQAVLIDLKRNRALWEDFYDTVLAKEREGEPRETREEVARRIRGRG